MEVVHVFNKELKSILDAKLPVSRHKMSLITKSAMKALKFYKHVVQSVEKFITKCSCDYKVPGLYVIDAIVRQSKHQYCDKDVFVPRFMRNIVTTFVHLSQCDAKDLMSIERVLRLWQQNGVFPTDLVENLLELVYDSSDNEKIINAAKIVARLVNEWNIQKGKPEEKIELFLPPMESLIPSYETPKTEGGLIDSITKLLTRFQAETGQDVSLEINQIQILHQKIVEQSALLAQGEMIDSDTLSQLHQSMEELTKKAAKAAAVQQSKLAMLASDDKDHMNEASTDLEFVEQLQQMVDTLGQTRVLQEELKQAMESKQSVVNNTQEVIELPMVDQDFRELEEGEEPYTAEHNEDLDLRLFQHSAQSNQFEEQNEHDSANNISFDQTSRTSSVGSRKRRRSNSLKSFGKRHRSRSREHKRKEKRNHDTRKRHLPTLRDQCVGIISHTMFIGHLHKHVQESKLRAVCEEFGTISEFNMIPPRGCAFVTFDKRKSTYKAIAKMNEMKFEGRNLKVAWAPNKGVKDEKEFREYWVEDEGCTYISTELFPINRSSELTEGSAELDDESLTEELKQAIYQFEQQKSEAVAQGIEPSSVETMISVAAEVVNKKIPLLSPSENMVDPNTPPFFNHFATPPPLIPAIIPFPPPPPPHMYMGQTSMPPLQRCPDISMINPMMAHPPNYADYQGLISSTEAGGPPGVSRPIDIGNHGPGYSPQPMMSPRLNDTNNLPHHVSILNHHHEHNSPPFLRPPGFRNPAMMLGAGRGGPVTGTGSQYPSSMRFSRPPPLGYPVFRGAMINRPPRF